LLPVVGLSAIINGFNSTKVHEANRHLSVGRTTLMNLSAQISGISMMVIIASQKPTVWALVFGGIFSAFIILLMSHFVLPGRQNRFQWDFESARAIIHYGKWIFLGTVLTFLAGQVDRLIGAKLITWSELGIYSIAFMLTDAPRQLLRRLGGAVIFPAISRRADIPREQLREKIVRNRRLILIVMAGGISLLAGLGDLLILLLWPENYAGASWMTSILALGLWPTVLFITIGPGLMSIGKPQYDAAAKFIRLLWISMMVIVAFHKYGLVGFIVVTAMADIPVYFMVQLGLRRERMSCLFQDIWTTILFLVMLAAVLLVRTWCGMELPEAYGILQSIW